MKATRFETTIDEAATSAMPALRPLLGRRVEIIAVEAASPPGATPGRKLTLDEFLADRLQRPPGTPVVTLQTIERAILAGALDGNV